MLNISKNSVNDKINRNDYSALKKVESKVTGKVLERTAKWTLLAIIVIAFLPWTQNVQTSGALTTLNPDQRPQEIQSVISGRIEQWKVKEGDFVHKGDTIAIISETKSEYFDPQIRDRYKDQIDLKKQSVGAYDEKINAKIAQLDALTQRRNLETEKIKNKILQLRLKIQNDSIAYITAKLDYATAKYQYERMDSLFQKGVKSLSSLEEKRLKAQSTLEKETLAKNKWLNRKNELLNQQIELTNLNAKYRSDYAKVQSEKFTSQSDKFDSETSVIKLENQYSNLEKRQSLYTITAPQDGYITKLMVQGIGETIKEGGALLNFMPKDYQLAVEVYVDPIDLPLMHRGETVRLQFDGWPAIVFSGWPGANYGTYGGEIYAIDQFISSNGKYRILVQPDETDHKWPKDLRVGGGTKAFILLDDVFVGYEVWRQINGFPPNFYQPNGTTETKKK